MRGAKGVELAFVTTRKTAQAVALAQRAHLVATPRQNFVWVSLMAHVPHDAVVRCVEHVVQSHGQLHRAEVGAEMPTCFGHGLNQVRAQLIGQRRQLVARHSTQVCGRVDGLQQIRHVYSSVPVHHALGQSSQRVGVRQACAVQGIQRLAQQRLRV